jgi:hypothetical protein
VYWVAIVPLKVVRPSALVSDLRAQDGPEFFVTPWNPISVLKQYIAAQD